MISGTSLFLILVAVAVVAVVVVLIRRSSRKSKPANTTPESASGNATLRSAISTGEEGHAAEFGTSVPDSSVKVLVPAEPAPEAEEEEEDAEPTAAALIAEGDEHMRAFDYDDAIESYEGAVDAVTAEHGRESLEFADLLVKTEDAYLARDNESDDELNCNDYLRALSIMERRLGAFDLRLLPVINRIIAFYLLVGKVSEAEGLVRRQQLIEMRAKVLQSFQQTESGDCGPARPIISIGIAH
jgi:hypothetical protein